MKLETTKERLEAAIGPVVRATTRQTALPILSCVLFDVREGTLTVRATNLDLGVEAVIPVKMESAGTLAVPGLLLQSLVGGLLPGALVSLSEDRGNLVVAAGGRRAVLKAVPHDEFPVIPRIVRKDALSLPVKDLLLGLRSVWYSAASSSLKPELGSVFLSIDGDTVTFAATDAFRLAEKRIRVPATDRIAFSHVLVPHKNIGEIIRIIEGLSGDVDLVVDGSQFGLYGEGLYVTSRLVDAVFPDYRQIIPSSHVVEVVVLKHDLLRALKGVMVFSDKLNQVRKRISPRAQRFELITANADIGESTEAIHATLSGDDLEIVFNHRYLADCFQSIPEESVVMRFGGIGKPLVIRGATDDSFLYLVMPMNV
jgi:DNA polymerase III subunit beta